jgi:site-specific recombinase XerD
MKNPLSSHEMWLSRLKDHLHEERYHPGNARQCIAAARNFLAFLEKQRTAIADAQPETVERYLKQAQRRYRRRHGHSPDYEGWRCSHTNGIHMLLRMVHGQWPPAPSAVTRFELYLRKLCEDFATSLAEMRGLAAETVAERRDEARRFLDWLGQRVIQGVADVKVTDVDAYMKHRAGPLRRASIKGVATRLRSFLRWLYATGQTARDLSVVVIAPVHYALGSIPSALRSEDMHRILSIARQERTAKGLRDHAMLMLLAKYGVRAGEITGLRLEDVDWRKEIIRIRHTKTGVTSYLPLLPEVGEAILNYLQKARPKTSSREVFIRSRAPYRAFKSGSSLYTPIRRRIDAAGIPAGGKRGPHSFRHARAVSMIQASVPLKAIGDLLGHRASDSALVYLKLATEDLRVIALDIPAEVKQ